MDTTFLPSPEVERAYYQTLAVSHEQRITMDVLNLNGRFVQELAPVALDGEVTINTQDRDVSRVLTASFVDITGGLDFEPNRTSGPPIYESYMLQVGIETLVPGYGWFGPKVFTGPMTRLDRTGALMAVAAAGKDSLANGNLGKNRTWRAKSKVTDIIKALMRETGEDQLGGIPNLPNTIPKRLNVTKMQSPWKAAKKLAASIGRVLFYDGAGRLWLKRRPKLKSAKIVIDRRYATSDLTTGRTVDGVFDRWIVLGKKPEGDKERPHANLALPLSHPLVRTRNGERLNRVRQTEDGKLKTDRQCAARARDQRDDDTRQTLENRGECIPIPALQEYDPVRYVTPLGAGTIRLGSATIPLGPGAAMSLGANTRTATRGGRG